MEIEVKITNPIQGNFSKTNSKKLSLGNEISLNTSKKFTNTLKDFPVINKRLIM